MKTQEFLNTELWSVIGNNCVWDDMSTKLLFKHSNHSVWSGVLKFTNFNKIWEISQQLWCNYFHWQWTGLWLLYSRVYLEFDETALASLHALLAWKSAQTMYISTRLLISEFIPGQNTMPLTFLKHDTIPWWLECNFESISDLMALGTITLWLLNRRLLWSEISSL